MKLRIVVGFTVLLLAATAAAAQTLKGTVTNGTTGKPAANVEVTLISLSQGMSETAHTRTDRSGAFSFDLGGDTGMPHLVRASYQDVNYFKMAPPGVPTADVEIYDAAAKLDGVANSVDVMRVQSDGTALQVLEVYAVQNASRPPRSLNGTRTFDIGLPEGAVIDQAAARAPNGQPISTSPAPVPGQKGRYSFDFPLRPGETQFEIAYHLPYAGQAAVKPVLLHDVQHFVAMLPKSMQFSASGLPFKPMPGADSDANVQVATNVHAGDRVVMNISGTGTLPDENAAAADNNNGPAAGGMSSRGGPGGGLGKPIGTPDPLTTYRWPLLGLLGAVLAAGGVYVATRRPPALASANADEEDELEQPAPLVAVAASKPVKAGNAHSSMLLDALKEELFQLEIEHQQGHISADEYAKAKAGLDETIRRAVTRKQ